MRSTIVLFFFLVILFTLAIFSGHEKVSVQTIIISGNASVTDNEILTIANRDMAGRYGYLFARNNSMIFPRFQIKKDLLAELKTIKDVDISWNTWQRVDINIVERKPDSVWCGADIKATDSECYFVDKNGFIYSRGPIFSGSMFIKSYGALSATSTSPIGQYFLPTEIYSQIYNLIQILDQNNIKVIAISYDGFDYRFTLDSGPEIIFNNKNGFSSVFTNLFSAIETKNLDLAADASVINYIDLRFDNKIVVGKKEVVKE